MYISIKLIWKYCKFKGNPLETTFQLVTFIQIVITNF